MAGLPGITFLIKRQTLLFPVPHQAFGWQYGGAFLPLEIATSQVIKAEHRSTSRSSHTPLRLNFQRHHRFQRRCLAILLPCRPRSLTRANCSLRSYSTGTIAKETSTLKSVRIELPPSPPIGLEPSSSSQSRKHILMKSSLP